MSLVSTPGDEHLSNENGQKAAGTSPNETSGTSSGTSSGTAATTETSATESTSPSNGTESRTDSNQSPVKAEGDSSDESTVDHQELQRSPPIVPPSPIRSIGHLGGNLQLFLTTTEYSENGESRYRESKFYIICDLK